MPDFINTIDELGDDVVFSKFMDETITEFNDNIITEVYPDIFSYQPNLTSVNLPNVEIIHQEAFYRCTSLTSFYFPSCITRIGNDAFSGSALTSLNLDFSNVLSIYGSIAQYAFRGLNNLQTVTIKGMPRTLVGDPYNANNVNFRMLDVLTQFNTSSLITVNLLDNPEFENDGYTIGSSTFDGCTNLRNFDFSKIAHIGFCAFKNCQAITSAIVPNYKYSTLESTCFYHSGINEVYIPRVKRIGGESFSECTSLTSVSLPDATIIHERAFSGCLALPSINLPRVEEIYAYAFADCISLDNVNLPKLTHLVGQAIFRECNSLYTIVVGNTDDVATLDNVNCFDGLPNEYKVFVPYALLNSYKSATNWSAIQEHIFAIAPPLYMIYIDMNGDGVREGYAVLRCNGREVELWGYSESARVTLPSGGQNLRQFVDNYAGSIIDTALNTTWYNSLSQTAKSAIIERDLYRYEYAYNVQSVSSEYYAKIGLADNARATDYIYKNVENDEWQNTHIGMRKAYLPGLEDIVESLGLTTLENGTKWLNIFSLPNYSTSTPSYSILLNSVCSGVVIQIQHNDHGLEVSRPTSGAENLWAQYIVAPCFTVDITKLDWSLSPT